MDWGDFVKMNPEIKVKWIDALRSGGYEQSHSYLHGSRDGYCCLGVLCDVSGIGHWIEGNDSTGAFFYEAGGNHPGVSKPPHAVLEAVGLSGAATATIAVSDLIIMNDSRGRSFNEIADWIEENL